MGVHVQLIYNVIYYYIYGVLQNPNYRRYNRQTLTFSCTDRHQGKQEADRRLQRPETQIWWWCPIWLKEWKKIDSRYFQSFGGNYIQVEAYQTSQGLAVWVRWEWARDPGPWLYHTSLHLISIWQYKETYILTTIQPKMEQKFEMVDKCYYLHAIWRSVTYLG